MDQPAMANIDARIQKDWNQLTALGQECMKQDLLTRLMRLAVMDPEKMEGLEVMALITLVDAGNKLKLAERIRSEMKELKAAGVEGNTEIIMDLLAEFDRRKSRRRKR